MPKESRLDLNACQNASDLMFLFFYVRTFLTSVLFHPFSCSDSRHAVRDVGHSDPVQSRRGHAAADLRGHASNVSAHTRRGRLVRALHGRAVWPGEGPRDPDAGHGAEAWDVIPAASVLRRRAAGQDEQHVLPPHDLQPTAHR